MASDSRYKTRLASDPIQALCLACESDLTTFLFCRLLSAIYDIIATSFATIQTRRIQKMKQSWGKRSICVVVPHPDSGSNLGPQRSRRVTNKCATFANIHLSSARTWTPFHHPLHMDTIDFWISTKYVALASLLLASQSTAARSTSSPQS